MKFKISDWTQLLLLATGIFLFVVDLFIINVSLPAIQRGLGMRNSQAQWVVVAYIIGYTSLLIISGKADARYGRKKLYLMGMLGFTLASSLCGLSTSPSLLLFGRILQGISAGLMVPQGISLIPVLFANPSKRIWAMGLYGSVAGAASVIGQLLGGILPDLSWMTDSWRLIFWINLPIGILVSVLASKKLPEYKDHDLDRLDYKGMILLSCFLICCIYPLIVGPEQHWPLWSFGILLLALLLLFIFIHQQKSRKEKARAPLIELSLLQNTAFRWGLLAAVAYYMVQDAYFIIHALQLQKKMGFSSTQTGLAFACQGIGYVLASVYAAKLLISKGKKVILFGIAIMVSALLAHLLVFDQPMVSTVSMFAMLCIYGVGCGTVLPALMTLALKDMATTRIGEASAIYLSIQQMSICLGIATVVGLYLHSTERPAPLMHSLSAPYLSSIALCVILLLLVAVFIYLSSSKANRMRPVEETHKRIKEG